MTPDQTIATRQARPTHSRPLEKTHKASARLVWWVSHWSIDPLPGCCQPPGRSRSAAEIAVDRRVAAGAEHLVGRADREHLTFRDKGHEVGRSPRSSGVWIDTSTVSPWSRRSASTRATISRRSPGSRPPNGSSSSISGRRRTSARASATRCRWPPESSAGRRAAETNKPDARERPSTAACRLRRGAGRVDAKPDILRRGQVRKEVVVLKEDRKRPLRPAEGEQVRPAKRSVPTSALEAGDGVEQRRLAAAGRADQAASAPAGTVSV